MERCVSAWKTQAGTPVAPFIFKYLFLALAGDLLEMSQPNAPTARTRVIREPERGVYDRETAYKILDEAFICHVGFVSADGQPFVIPTSYGRDGDNLYIHGSA